MISTKHVVCVDISAERVQMIFDFETILKVQLLEHRKNAQDSIIHG